MMTDEAKLRLVVHRLIDLLPDDSLDEMVGVIRRLFAFYIPINEPSSPMLASGKIKGKLRPVIERPDFTLDPNED